MEGFIFLIIWFVPMLLFFSIAGFIVEYIEKKRIEKDEMVIWIVGFLAIVTTIAWVRALYVILLGD